MRETTLLLAMAVALTGCGAGKEGSSDPGFPSVGNRQCAMDTDCKGDRICEKGACMAPDSSRERLPSVKVGGLGSSGKLSMFEVPDGDIIRLENGVLELVEGKDGFGKAIKFGGRILRDDGDAYISALHGFNIQGRQIVLFSVSSGGTACPALQVIIDVAVDGTATATDSFGTCTDENPSVSLHDDAIVMSLSGFRGPFDTEEDRMAAALERHVFTYRGGQLIEG